MCHNKLNVWQATSMYTECASGWMTFYPDNSSTLPIKSLHLAWIAGPSMWNLSIPDRKESWTNCKMLWATSSPSACDLSMTPCYVNCLNKGNNIKWYEIICVHYSDVIMSVVASEITGVSIICSTVCSGAEKTQKSPRHWPSCGESTGDRQPSMQCQAKTNGDMWSIIP